jgi:hypothetical protein
VEPSAKPRRYVKVEETHRRQARWPSSLARLGLFHVTRRRAVPYAPNAVKDVVPA